MRDIFGGRTIWCLWLLDLNSQIRGSATLLTTGWGHMSQVHLHIGFQRGVLLPVYWRASYILSSLLPALLASLLEVMPTLVDKLTFNIIENTVKYNGYREAKVQMHMCMISKETKIVDEMTHISCGCKQGWASWWWPLSISDNDVSELEGAGCKTHK
ncbi:hypothetical protein BDR03DRAFT_987032 [Suillus americanus]|nr:hypothetical protein BDR03DRAFT_987032 [Suillus americanus]